MLRLGTKKYEGKQTGGEPRERPSGPRLPPYPLNHKSQEKKMWEPGILLSEVKKKGVRKNWMNRTQANGRGGGGPRGLFIYHDQ